MLPGDWGAVMFYKTHRSTEEPGCVNFGKIVYLVILNPFGDSGPFEKLVKAHLHKILHTIPESLRPCETHP